MEISIVNGRGGCRTDDIVLHFQERLKRPGGLADSVDPNLCDSSWFQFRNSISLTILYRFSIAFLRKLTNLFRQNFCRFQLALPTWAFLVHSLCKSCQILVSKKLIPIRINRYAALELVVHPRTILAER